MNKRTDIDDSKEVARPEINLPVKPLSSFEMKSIEWLDKPLFQNASFHLLCGPKGTGKGTYLAQLAAKVTRGSTFGEPRNVLFLSTEDSASIDLLPRVVAAEGDAERVFVVTKHLTFPDEMELLRDIAAQVGDVGMLVVDPLGNHLGGVNTDGEGVVRNAIAPFNDLADELGCLVIGVRHLSKNRERGALASVLGSTAWVDVPRAVLVVAADNEDENLRHIQVVAGNRSRSGAGRRFRIEMVDVGLLELVTRAVEEEGEPKSVDSLLQNGQPSQSKSAQARTLILDLLEAAPGLEMDTESLDAEVAQSLEIKAQTIRNIRADLKNKGLIKAVPEKGEEGEVRRWVTRRTGAPREALKPETDPVTDPKNAGASVQKPTNSEPLPTNRVAEPETAQEPYNKIKVTGKANPVTETQEPTSLLGSPSLTALDCQSRAAVGRTREDDPRLIELLARHGQGEDVARELAEEFGL